MKKEHLTSSARQTQNLGKKLAQEILQDKPAREAGGAFVLGLTGELGGGKTTFLQGFAQGLGVKEKVLSPTFVLMKHFQIKHPRYKNFYHIDCYRIEGPKEILGLGFEEIISDPKNIVAIEWAERIEDIISKRALQIRFQMSSVDKRKIEWYNVRAKK